MQTGKTILIIEDDPNQQEIYSVALQKVGYNTVVRGDPRKGLIWLEQILPDAILLDMMLPGLSGIDMLQMIRDNPNGQEVPVIVATASAELQASDFDRFHIFAFLRKPVLPSALVETVNKVFN